MENSERLRAARQVAGLTQAQVAERTGVARSNIAAYESGKRALSEAMASKLIDSIAPRPGDALLKNEARVVEIVLAHKATNPRVFGSVSRDEDQYGSDVDILVHWLPGAGLFDQVRMTRELEELLGVKVDVASDSTLRESPRGFSILHDARTLTV